VVASSAAEEVASVVLFARRVSGSPGAEGAPRSGIVEDEVDDFDADVLLELVGWDGRGAIRSDCVSGMYVSGGAWTQGEKRP